MGGKGSLFFFLLRLQKRGFEGGLGGPTNKTEEQGSTNGRQLLLYGKVNHLWLPKDQSSILFLY